MSKNTEKPSGLYRFGKGLCRFLTGIFLMPRYIGAENIPQDKNFILCCNHVSFIDPVLLALKAKSQIYFMAKKELFSIPVFSSFLKSIGTFPVDRKKSDIAAIRSAMELVNGKKSMGIFPEGTRSKTGKIAEFKVGAAMIASKTQTGVLPAAIYVKSGKMRWFSRPVIIYGKPLSLEQLGIQGKSSSAQVHTASDIIRKNVTALWEDAERSCKK